MTAQHRPVPDRPSQAAERRHRKLPASLDDLGGLRAARWVRESTAGQTDRYGPDAQKEQADRAIDRYGLTDSGIGWTVAHSGRTIAETPEWGEMLARAGTDYDVLVVGYVSRFARDARTALNARHDLHAAGAAILFADERILTSDEDRWHEWYRETGEAEAYSHKLARRVAEGYRAKFARLADPGGNPPLGFVRDAATKRLAIDPATITLPVRIFERYASGRESLDTLAREFDCNRGMLAELLRNRIYNGWVQRHGEWAPAAWRSSPPVSDSLWARVADLRERNRRGGGPTPPGRVDPLRHLLYCPAGHEVWANGLRAESRRRAHPPGGCPEWVGQRTFDSATWEAPIAAQVAGVRLDEPTMAAVVAVLQEPEVPPVPLDRARVEARRRSLALDFAGGRLSQDEFTTAIASIAAEPEAVPMTDTVAPDAAFRWLADLPAMWEAATEAERAELIAAIYDRITVRGSEFVSARLTPSAYAHGLALALPETVRVGGVSPEGFEPSTK